MKFLIFFIKMDVCINNNNFNNFVKAKIYYLNKYTNVYKKLVYLYIFFRLINYINLY